MLSEKLLFLSMVVAGEWLRWWKKRKTEEVWRDGSRDSEPWTESQSNAMPKYIYLNFRDDFAPYKYFSIN